MQKLVANFRPLISGMLILLLTIIVPLNLTAQSGKLKVYIWDFTTRDRTRDELTRNFNVEFEEALIQSQYYDILLRRDYDKLFGQKANEKGILSIEGIPEPQLDSLKILQADAIIFGEIYDDIKGGVIRITICLQAFNSKILAQHSTLLRRGLKDDPLNREITMSDLSKKFSPVDGGIKPEKDEPLSREHTMSNSAKRFSPDIKKLSFRPALKTKQKAIIKSLAFPGWGQYYAERNNKAIIYALCETAALAGSFLFNYKHSQAIDDFNIAKDSYAAAVSQVDMDQYFQQMETKHDDLKNAEKIRNLCISVAAGIGYGLCWTQRSLVPKQRKRLNME
jgi:hypothetical protein